MKLTRLRDILALCEWLVTQSRNGTSKAMDMVMRNHLAEPEEECEVLSELDSAYFNLSHAMGVIDIMRDMIDQAIKEEKRDDK